jgi:Domain of unknown function (DUF222)
MACSCGTPDCPAAGADTPANPIVINVLADAATVADASGKPGYLPGYGAIPAATVQQMAPHASLRPGSERARSGRRAAVPALGGTGAVHSAPGSDLSLARLRSTGDGIRYRQTVPYPHGPTHPSNTKPYCRIHRVHKRLRQAN